MDITLRDTFTVQWQKHFPGVGLPLALEFRHEPGDIRNVPAPGDWRCLICQLGRARTGTPLIFDRSSVTCAGGLMYSGYCQERPPNFRYFLSSGKVGVVEGERYKQSSEIVDSWEKLIPEFSMQGKNLHVTRWDKLSESSTSLNLPP